MKTKITKKPTWLSLLQTVAENLEILTLVLEQLNRKNKKRGGVERVLAELNQATVEAETKAYMSTRQCPAVWCPEKCNGLQVKCEARCILRWAISLHH